MSLRCFCASDVDLFRKLDHQVYPTQTPVTSDVMNSWYCRHPEFALIYEEDCKIVAVCLMIALTGDGWRKLSQGEMTEAEIGPASVYDASRGDEEIGLHFYHVEKLDERFHHCCERSLADLGMLLAALEGSPRLAGLSALAVSPGGLWLFGHKMNFRERSFVVDEHMLTCGDSLEVFACCAWNDLQKKLAEGYEYRNRCQMLVLLPGEPSVAWQYMKLC
mmetsp:Transcript_9429/g.26270  ORF Transcript_9429/g.26270 Transcript_9429/m.26270 type:complete len:219 (-) Transcript_9429:170-826(-)|eukprot:CAMPEP_0194479132 /NCGR_PEP_ID=MMETSP0253-20130528/2356_1 /TAXON_ID=2966 /ORGANISM="Noctiluca scintillans" /LENGTH=218 /DNA_ID=CAMNT_0039318309 /DNA_START=27 /DNA_END=683 /DNA_ORIENTATION=+